MNGLNGFLILSPFPLNFLIFSPFPHSLSISSFSLHFHSISSFSLHFLFISSSFPHSLSISSQPGCKAATIPTALTHARHSGMCCATASSMWLLSTTLKAFTRSHCSTQEEGSASTAALTATNTHTDPQLMWGKRGRDLTTNSIAEEKHLATSLQSRSPQPQLASIPLSFVFSHEALLHKSKA